MSKDQLLQRMLCSEAEVDAQRVKTGDLRKIYETIKNPVKLFTITEEGIELEEISK